MEGTKVISSEIVYLFGVNLEITKAEVLTKNNTRTIKYFAKRLR